MIGALGMALAGYVVHEEALPDGDTLVVVEDHRAPVVFFRLEIPVGRHSPWGLAHDSRTAWNIQLYDPDRALRSRADRLAVQLDLGQTPDAAWLSVSCLRDDLDAAVALVSDVLANEDFDRKELRRWKKGRRLDKRSRRTDPDMQGAIATRRLLFRRDDPRRVPWESDPRMERDPQRLAATRDAMRAQPGRILGVAGDVTPADGRALAERLLPPPSPIDGVASLEYAPLTQRKEGKDLIDVPMPRVTQVTFRWVRDGLTWADPDVAAALVASHVLAGHAHARLGQALRYDEAATYTVQLHGELEPAADALTIYTYSRVDNADRAEQVLRDALATFHADGITAEELSDAVTHLTGSAAFREQGPWNPMGTRMWELRYGLPAGTWSAAHDGAKDLTLDEVNAFIRRFWDPAEFAMVRVVPK